MSLTYTTAPARRTDAGEADRVRQQSETGEDYPLVDAALRSTGEGRHSAGAVDAGCDGLRSLRRDVDRMAATATEIASGATSLAKSEVRGFVQEVEGKIRERPIAAVVIVAAVAFIFGATRQERKASRRA